MIPKYKLNQQVRFELEGELVEGTISIIDENGIFGDKSCVYYDIFSESNNCLYKHIREPSILKS